MDTSRIIYEDNLRQLQITAKAIHETTNYGDFDIYIIMNTFEKLEHIALIKGDVKNKNNVLCRISSECLTGTVIDSSTCDCSQQINKSLELIKNEGSGIFIYLRQEGRGHGLTSKIRALKFKNKGYNTFEAVENLGLASDIRKYFDASEIIKYFGVRSIKLLTSNPQKAEELIDNGVSISELEPLNVLPTDKTIQHIIAKKNKGFKI